MSDTGIMPTERKQKKCPHGKRKSQCKECGTGASVLFQLSLLYLSSNFQLNLQIYRRNIGTHTTFDQRAPID